jgi:hypothetical protein
LVLHIGVKVLYSVPEKHLKITIFSEVKDYFMFELCSKIVNIGIEGTLVASFKGSQKGYKMTGVPLRCPVESDCNFTHSCNSAESSRKIGIFKSNGFSPAIYLASSFKRRPHIRPPIMSIASLGLPLLTHKNYSNIRI